MCPHIYDVSIIYTMITALRCLILKWKKSHSQLRYRCDYESDFHNGFSFVSQDIDCTNTLIGSHPIALIALDPSWIAKHRPSVLQ